MTVSEKDKTVYSVLLAGGSGSRLWPLSRELSPKQLANLVGSDSLIQSTIKRLFPLLDEENVRIVCGIEHLFETKRHLEAMGITSEDKILSEPCGRNTAPAILLALLTILEHEDDALVLVFPADHVITDKIGFHEKLSTALLLAEKDYIVTFGIQPGYPETGYGYVEGAGPVDGGAMAIKRFVEKPDMERAREYVEAGNFFWNSGMFAFKASIMVEEFKLNEPVLVDMMTEMLSKDGSIPLESYEALPGVSIDYAIMEKTERGAVLPSDFGWSDIGSWKSLYDILPKDKDNNVLEGDIMHLETRGSFIKADQRLVVTNGLEDMVVVDTPDAVFVSTLDKSKNVKSIVNELRDRGRKEYRDHTTVHRQWGMVTTLEEDNGSKTRRLVIFPGAGLPSQVHHYGSKHWIVVQGSAEVSKGDETVSLRENQSTYIPIATQHCLQNIGSIPLHIVEVQMGDCVEEDENSPA